MIPTAMIKVDEADAAFGESSGEQAVAGERAVAGRGAQMNRQDQDVTAAGVIADLRRQRHVRKYHRLGPRVIDALLIEIGAERGITTIIERKIEAYAEIEPEALEAAGGDQFPPAPLYEVRS